MPPVVSRIRFISGHQTHVAYHPAESIQEHEVVDHVTDVLCSDTGVLRCQHGDELSPRGAVL